MASGQPRMGYTLLGLPPRGWLRARRTADNFFGSLPAAATVFSANRGDAGRIKVERCIRSRPTVAGQEWRL